MGKPFSHERTPSLIRQQTEERHWVIKLHNRNLELYFIMFVCEELCCLK